jgi:hypothetical protein
MKMICTSVVLVVVFAGRIVSSQVSNEIELTRSVVQSQRQAIVEAALNLTESESAGFWPLYQSYREDMARIEDRSVELITEYGENYDILTEEQAESMLQEHMDIQRAELKIRQKYLKSFRKVIPPMKLTRFYQLENKMDAAIDYELALEIPLIPDD